MSTDATGAAVSRRDDTLLNEARQFTLSEQAVEEGEIYADEETRAVVYSNMQPHTCSTFPTKLTKLVWDMTVDEANWLLRRYEQGIVNFTEPDLNDLTLRASGISIRAAAPTNILVTCVVDGKLFPAHRSDALYCSNACQLKAARRRRNDGVKGRMVP